MSLPFNEMCDKVSTQLFEGEDRVWGKLAEPYPCWPLQCGREGSTHDFVWNSL